VIPVIVESPLRGATGSPEEYERNRIYARRCVRWCLLNGRAPFASHLIYAQPGILDDCVPEERERGIQAGYAWARLAAEWIFFIDYGWSTGMLEQKARFDAAAPWRPQRGYAERKIGPNPEKKEQ